MKQYCVGYLTKQGEIYAATLFGFAHSFEQVKANVANLNIQRPNRDWLVLERDIPEWKILSEDPEISDGEVKV